MGADTREEQTNTYSSYYGFGTKDSTRRLFINTILTEEEQIEYINMRWDMREKLDKLQKE